MLRMAERFENGTKKNALNLRGNVIYPSGEILEGAQDTCRSDMGILFGAAEISD